MIGSAELKDQMANRDLILKKLNMLHMINKGKEYVAKEWLSSPITTKCFGQAERLFNMLRALWEKDKEWFTEAIEVIEAKFGPFVCAKAGEFEMCNKGLLRLIEAWMHLTQDWDRPGVVDEGKFDKWVEEETIGSGLIDRLKIIVMLRECNML
jgi:hypothetical protein